MQLVALLLQCRLYTRYDDNVGEMVADARGPTDSISSCDLVKRNRSYTAHPSFFNAQCIHVKI